MSGEIIKSFNGVKLPPGARKGVPKTWLFKGESGLWVLKTKTWIIHKFGTQKEAEDWLALFCEHRGQMYKAPVAGAPFHKARRQNMGPAKVSNKRIYEMTKDATKSGYEPK